ncbi:MAG: HNH endonuclease [Turicibacter sp.]|nr:HNH endonuclease [Turicibacter sp.]
MVSNFENEFLDCQSDFYHYMVNFGNLAPKTSRDYLTRLKFLSQSYPINYSLTAEKITEILVQEDMKRLHRPKYSSKKSISDFRSGLNKFLKFVEFDYAANYEQEILQEVKRIENGDGFKKTEKDAIIKSRIGQGHFRKELMDYWKGCAVSQCSMKEILVASHIKPWRVSNNHERLDPFNGLLLLPNYDKIFDLGYMTFDFNGEMIFSKFLPEENKRILHLSDDLVLSRIEENHKPYLEYHHERCFLG